MAPPKGSSVFATSTPVTDDDELTGQTSPAGQEQSAVEKLNETIKNFNGDAKTPAETPKREYPEKFPNIISYGAFKKDIKELAEKCSIDKDDALLLAAEELGVEDLLDLKGTRAAEFSKLKSAWTVKEEPPTTPTWPFLMGDEGNFKGFLADVAKLGERAKIPTDEVTPRALHDLGISGWMNLEITRQTAYSKLQALWIPKAEAQANKDEESSDPLNETPQQKVARKLNAAFPDKDREWKIGFLPRTLGHISVASAIAAQGESLFFSKLDQAILNEQKAAAEPPKDILGQAVPSAVAPKAPVVQDEAEANDEPQDAEVPKEESGFGLAPEIVLDNPPSAVTVIPPTPTENTRTEIVKSSPTSIGRRSVDLNSLGLPKHDDLEELFQWANFVAKSKFFKGVDTVEKAMVLFWMGISLGETAMAALSGFDVIPDKEGFCQLYPKAKYLKSRADKSGLLSRFDIIQEPTKCTVYIQRKDRPTYNTYVYTLEDAEKAGLLERYNNNGKVGDLKRKAWNNPKRQCMNRCVHLAVSTECPQVLFDLPPLLLDEEDTEDAV